LHYFFVGPALIERRYKSGQRRTPQQLACAPVARDVVRGDRMILLLVYLILFSVALLGLDLIVSGAMLAKFIAANVMAFIGFCAMVPWLFEKVYPKIGLVLEQRMLPEQGFSANPPMHELLGKTGVAVTDLHPVGTARFGDRHVDVVAENFMIPEGTPIRVTAVQGSKVVVRPV
jgi:membrane-bound serine protease (ClpP class)